jgi:hypothetical protein
MLMFFEALGLAVFTVFVVDAVIYWPLRFLIDKVRAFRGRQRRSHGSAH